MLGAAVGWAGYVGKKAVDLIPMWFISKPNTNVDYQDGIVYLHQFPAKWTRQVPNMSPFAMKLETWLRLKKIKYEVGFEAG